MKRSFTLIELIVVIIIVGILATLAFVQYTKVIEKGRTAEARSILGTIRTAEAAYKLEYGEYAALADLPVEAPTSCPATAATVPNYFQYSVTTTDTTTPTFTAKATRCGTGTGKTPGYTTTYDITLDQDGNWGGTAGYY